jgi:hypothetical protein
MKRALATLLNVALLLTFAMAAKMKFDAVLVPSSNQPSLPPLSRDRANGFLIRRAGRPFDVSAGMVPRNGETAELLLKITNESPKPLVFNPAEIIVVLPNGHSYRPFTQTDAMQEAYDVDADPKARKPFTDKVAVSEASLTASCTLDSDNVTCPTTADVSTERWRARRSALRGMTKTALEHNKAKNYVRAIREQYLAGAQLAPGETISGYVDLFVEDVHGGPFIVRVPAGDTKWIAPGPGKLAVPVSTYDISFGPEIKPFQPEQ